MQTYMPTCTHMHTHTQQLTFVQSPVILTKTKAGPDSFALTNKIFETQPARESAPLLREILDPPQIRIAFGRQL